MVLQMPQMVLHVTVLLTASIAHSLEELLSCFQGRGDIEEEPNLLDLLASPVHCLREACK